MKLDIFFAVAISLVWLVIIVGEPTFDNITSGLSVLFLLTVCILKQKRIVNLERKFEDIGG